MKPTHAVQISFFLDPQRRAPEQILRDWWPLVVGADMVARAGARITVIQACHQNRSLMHEGIDYHFVAPMAGHASIATAPVFARLLRELAPDILHVHGLGFAADVLRLERVARGVPIYLQDHADRVPSFWRRARLRRSLSLAAGVSFCAHGQAEPFLRARLLPRSAAPRRLARTRIFEIPEVTSPFTPGDRAAARRATGIHGNPAILWVGHLDANKDPLAVLRGVAEAVARLPELHLWCCYGTAPLADAVRALIAGDSRLAARVHLLGKVEHHHIELLMRGADLFVLGSHREGSGGALIEAMATGLPPVVTDIPSFRALTAGGTIGALWTCATPGSLRDALISVASREPVRERERVLAHFAAEISPAAVGRKFLAAYREMISAEADA